MIDIIRSGFFDRIDLIRSKVFSSKLDIEENRVRAILKDVQSEGDDAVFAYTQQFDGVHLDASTMRVSDDELQAGAEVVSSKLKDAIDLAIKNIKDHHAYQQPKSWVKTRDNGAKHGLRYSAIDRVGLYVPGGEAVYPSTFLMNAIPAIIAGVGEIVVVTPIGLGAVNPLILYAAKQLGITEIYKIGGAQAIAALSYGTETIKKVDKIVGPGNIYVTLAKRLVYGLVDIDKMAGPSDITVVADDQSDPRFVAADLCSQAEHDVLASAICVTNSLALAQAVKDEIELIVTKSPRKAILKKSLKENSVIMVLDQSKIVDVVNYIAPEHLELMTSEPRRYLDEIKHAGAIFIGAYTPEPVGDYMAGCNHVLPTAGAAKFSSPLGVDDFLKKTSIIEYSEQAFKAESDAIVALAEAEGLACHAWSIRVRNT
jgi:histidinol dehydrogenase